MTITLTREEAQQVLDAIKQQVNTLAALSTKAERYSLGAAIKQDIETLCARLDKPEPKPACWLYKGEVRLSPSDLPPTETIALYTAPSQRKWQGLTDEDRQELAAEQYGWEGLCSAVEAKLREKNCAPNI